MHAKSFHTDLDLEHLLTESPETDTVFKGNVLAIGIENPKKAHTIQQADAMLGNISQTCHRKCTQRYSCR